MFQTSDLNASWFVCSGKHGQPQKNGCLHGESVNFTRNSSGLCKPGTYTGGVGSYCLIANTLSSINQWNGINKWKLKCQLQRYSMFHNTNTTLGREWRNFYFLPLHFILTYLSCTFTYIVMLVLFLSVDFVQMISFYCFFLKKGISNAKVKDNRSLRALTRCCDVIWVYCLWSRAWWILPKFRIWMIVSLNFSVVEVIFFPSCKFSVMQHETK